MKRVVLVLIFLMLILPMLSAVEVDMKSQYSSGETLLAQISGNFVDQITPSNVFFYKNHTKIPVDFGVERINNDFYVYGILTGKTEGDYSLQIQGVRYYKATQISDEDIISNFSITNETAMFSVNPGVVKTNRDFSVELQNLQDKKITIGISGDSAIASPDSITLNTGEKKEIDFSADISEQALHQIVFSSGDFSYELPVYLYPNQTTTVPGERSFSFQPSSVNISMATDSVTKRIIYIKNTGEENLENISFSVSSTLAPYISLTSEKIDTLEFNSTKQVEMNIISDEVPATLQGSLIAYTENLSTALAITINFIPDFVPATSENNSVVTTCSDLSGTLCAVGEECDSEVAYVRDGICCLGTCQEVKKSSSGKIIGWGLLIVILLAGIWFFLKKYKGVRQKKLF